LRECKTKIIAGAARAIPYLRQEVHSLKVYTQSASAVVAPGGQGWIASFSAADRHAWTRDFHQRA